MIKHKWLFGGVAITANVLGLCDVGDFLHQSQIVLLMLN